MKINKAVKESGDATKVQKSKTSVSSQVNKVVSEGGDSKTVFVDRKEIAGTKVNHKKCDDIKTQKTVDGCLKPHKKSNQLNTENTSFIDRKPELIIRKYNDQNTTKEKDIIKRSERREPFISSPAKKGRGTTATVIDKGVTIPSTQGLVNNVTKTQAPQKLTPKDIRKRYDAKEIPKKIPANNECSQDSTEKVCDNDVRIPSNQEIVTNVSTKKPDPRVTTRRDWDITRKSAGKVSVINSPGNKERNRNFSVNLYNKDIEIPSKDFINNEKYDFESMAIKDTAITKLLNSQKSIKNCSVNNKHGENVKLNVNNRDTKIPSKPGLNNVSINKYKPHHVNTKYMQQRHVGNESNRTFSVTGNKEYDQNTTVIIREDTKLNNVVQNETLELDEKKNVIDKNMNKVVNTKKSNSINNKLEDFMKTNFRYQTTEAKMKNDRSPKNPSQQNKQNGELVEKIENDSSSHTGIYSSDVMEEIKLPVTSPPPLRKRAVIKTITARNDGAKLYKAVAFVEQKKKRTPLKINLADAFKQPKTGSDRRIKPTFSKGSVKDKVLNEKVIRKKEKLKKDKLKHIQSPKPSEPQSPHTEVAKWAPNCINNHTKLYYEAWVDTTLAAISKDSRNEKLFLEKHNVFQKGIEALAEGPYIPELVNENLTDERFMGRIKIRQR